MELERDKRAVETERKFDEIDESRERQAEALEKLENRHLAAKARADKDVPLCSRCGLPLHGKTHGYCAMCREAVDNGTIDPMHRAEPHYKQRKCACGNWFEPTTARGKKCRRCRDKEGDPMTTGTKKRRRYSPQSKKLYVEKVNEFKEKGTMSSDDCYKKAGQIALGTDGNSFSYRNWAKQLGIETVSMNPGHRPPQDNAEDEKKPKQAEKKPATDTKGHRYNARGHRIYTDAEKQDLIDRVADMMSRGIPAQKAIALASKTILGKVIPDTQFYRWRKQAAERKADKLGVTKAATKAKQLEAMSVTAITDWLKGVDDADVLIDLQEALDVRKAEVHEAVEQQAEILLAQLSKLAPRKAKPQPPAESTTTDVLRTGQEQPPSQAE